MFAGSLLKSVRSLSIPQNVSILHQQVRFSKKSFNLKSGFYGVEPLITTDDYEDAKEADKLEELSYMQIRFPLITENNSPLYDKDYEKFVRYCMKDGRKGMFHDMVHKTMANIKVIQYNKLKKLKEKQGKGSLMTLEFMESIQNTPIDETNADDERAKLEFNPLTILKTALANCEPLVITMKVKRGGATYQVPYPLSRDQSEYYALKWITKAVYERPKPRKKQFPEAMCQEILDAYHKGGKVVKRRDDIHRLADANKAYAHYRWG